MRDSVEVNEQNKPKNRPNGEQEGCANIQSRYVTWEPKNHKSVLTRVPETKVLLWSNQTVKGKVRQAFRRIKAKGGNQRPRENVGTLREEG